MDENGAQPHVTPEMQAYSLPALVALFAGYTWLREKRMARRMDQLENDYHELSKEYRDYLKTMVTTSQEQTRQCMEALSNTAKINHASMRLMGRVKCVQMVDCKDEGDVSKG